MESIAAAVELAVESIDRAGADRRLIPVRYQTESAYRARPEIFRAVDQVDLALREVFRGLIAGELPWPLFLWGPVGSGKTRAVLCLCDHVAHARFWAPPDIMDWMARHDPPWQWSIDTSLAILDEVGLQVCGEDGRGRFEFDALKQFADWRDERPAVYVSNHPPAMIEELYDLRIESRLTCGTVFELTGPDRRFEGAELRESQKEK